jgi:cytochrome oxidase Cu insertion factor (SCO1/SenC/PrrC family)
VRQFVLAAVMCVILGGLGALLASQTDSRAPAARQARFTPPREEAFDFKLKDQYGKTRSLASARGKVVVLIFIYTSCWDLCPAQAEEVADAVDEVGDGVVTYAVSVDPVGDTRSHVQRWLLSHQLNDKPFLYLTGTRKQLARVWRAYGITPIGATHAEALASAENAYKYMGAELANPDEEEAEPPYQHPERTAPDAAKQDFPDTDDMKYRGKPRHVQGLDFEHSAYALLIDKEGEQRVGFPFEQLTSNVLAQDIRLLRG